MSMSSIESSWKGVDEAWCSHVDSEVLHLAGIISEGWLLERQHPVDEGPPVCKETVVIQMSVTSSPIRHDATLSHRAQTNYASGNLT